MFIIRNYVNSGVCILCVRDKKREEVKERLVKKEAKNMRRHDMISSRRREFLMLLIIMMMMKAKNIYKKVKKELSRIQDMIPSFSHLPFVSLFSPLLNFFSPHLFFFFFSLFFSVDYPLRIPLKTWLSFGEREKIKRREEGTWLKRGRGGWVYITRGGGGMASSTHDDDPNHGFLFSLIAKDFPSTWGMLRCSEMIIFMIMIAIIIRVMKMLSQGTLTSCQLSSDAHLLHFTFSSPMTPEEIYFLVLLLLLLSSWS